VPDAHAPHRSDGQPSKRSPEERLSDHAAIDRLAAELLPALVAKLGATGLGELEVREGGWRVRLRRPATAGAATSGRDRRRDRGERGDHRDAGGERGHDRPGRGPAASSDGHRDAPRNVATSPAVGIYRPRTDLAAGSRVQAGDRLGAVEMLGIPQEVVAPVDGIVGVSLAESGDAVEYGQELLVIEAAFVASSGNGHVRGAVDVP
jgi:acetyl-CoA carboxylase biotin carboxyl carrier protein